ncbi:hypothetical protein [Streptomyces lydicamycinicus]|uniref:hypothetical protein n=1 Tax=Streptomyces lydicamycinicus TaxID=1546107 RepID=UPI003C30DE45
MTTVLALYRSTDIAEHREALCEWIKVNGIDPKVVSDRWISVEEQGGRRVIRYRALKHTPDGRRLVDPDDPDQAWAEERTAPLLTGLPEGPSRCVMSQSAGGGG